MTQVLRIMSRPVGRIQSNALSRERWRDLEEAFGSEMEVLTRDTGGKCQPCCVMLEPHFPDAQGTRVDARSWCRSRGYKILRERW